MVSATRTRTRSERRQSGEGKSHPAPLLYVFDPNQAHASPLAGGCVEMGNPARIASAGVAISLGKKPRPRGIFPPNLSRPGGAIFIDIAGPRPASFRTAPPLLGGADGYDRIRSHF